MSIQSSRVSGFRPINPFDLDILLPEFPTEMAGDQWQRSKTACQSGVLTLAWPAEDRVKECAAISALKRYLTEPCVKGLLPLGEPTHHYEELCTGKKDGHRFLEDHGDTFSIMNSFIILQMWRASHSQMTEQYALFHYAITISYGKNGCCFL